MKSMVLRLSLYFLIAVSLHWVAFEVLSTNLFLGPATTPLAEPPPAIIEEPQQAPSDAPEVLVVESESYQLLYPAEFAPLMPLDQVCALIDSCVERIEGLFGPFEARVYIAIPGRISGGDDFPSNLTIQGVTFVDDEGRIRVYVALPCLGSAVMTHELCHARLRDLGCDPPRWLEEGMAEYVEQPDGYRDDFVRMLAEEGEVSNARLDNDQGVAEDEMRVRATAWAMVYHLVHESGLQLREIPDFQELPRTSEVVGTVFREALMRIYAVIDTEAEFVTAD